ncbi:hypothetical protein NECAME_05689 [Necator americanus]|uniref:Uncharacterized protein n=1 Tax=Necator americanus TaxID=51031 RepID=W2SHW9_NECAM|nr:hypothetical protein NECAME_05689 [Necator americanus]ETN68322.1 hypothetical protein NECAME_05689 [Necator americanus]
MKGNISVSIRPDIEPAMKRFDDAMMKDTESVEDSDADAETRSAPGDLGGVPQRTRATKWLLSQNFCKFRVILNTHCGIAGTGLEYDMTKELKEFPQAES